MSAPGTPPVHLNPPFAVVSDKDHSGWIIICTTIGIPILLIFGTIRYVVRRAVDLGLDDGLIAASTVIAIIQACLVLGACSDGFGKSVDDIQAEDLVSLQQLYYGSNIFFLISLALSKASVAALLLRLCVDEIHRRYFIGALAFAGLWLMASIFASSLQCSLSQPWILFGERCDSVLLRWQVIGGIDIAWEVVLIAMTAALVWNLQASVVTKLQVVSAFLFRLPLIVAVAFRLRTFPESRLTIDPSFELAAFVVWTQAELYWSIMSATIPSMRPFLRGLSTTDTAVFEASTDPAARADYELSKMRSESRTSRFIAKISSVNRSQHSQAHEPIEMRPIPEKMVDQITRNRVSQCGYHSSQKEETERDSIDSGSNESQHMIIRKDVTWTVARDSK